jgi:hypothetical protein
LVGPLSGKGPYFLKTGRLTAADLFYILEDTENLNLNPKPEAQHKTDKAQHSNKTAQTAQHRQHRKR